MRSNALLSVAVGVLVSSLLALTAHAAFRVMTESFPPFNFTVDEEVQGISVELLQETLRRMGRDTEAGSIELMPWARAYNIIIKEPDTVLFSMARTIEREEHFKWAGPIFKVDIGVIALKSRKIRVAIASELNRYTVGTVRDGAPEELIIKAGIDPKALDRSGDSLSNIRKLASGRIDVFAFPVPVARYLMKHEGLNPDDFENVLTLKEVELYYSFNKDTDDALVDEFQKTLDSLGTPGADGKSIKDSIVEKYIGSAN